MRVRLSDLAGQDLIRIAVLSAADSPGQAFHFVGQCKRPVRNCPDMRCDSA
jgi:hypothetical protein